jgi:hypothetical protein
LNHDKRSRVFYPTVATGVGKGGEAGAVSHGAALRTRLKP